MRSHIIFSRGQDIKMFLLYAFLHVLLCSINGTLYATMTKNNVRTTGVKLYNPWTICVALRSLAGTKNTICHNLHYRHIVPL